MPFTINDLNAKVAALVKEMGLHSVQATRVLMEFRDAGIIDPYKENNKNMLRFKHKIGTTTEIFGSAISAVMEPRFQFGPEDFGDNDTTLANPKSWKGISRRLFGQI
jgi:hypothetical protein